MTTKGGAIDFASVADTPRGAMVNWLMRRCEVDMSEDRSPEQERDEFMRHARLLGGYSVGSFLMTLERDLGGSPD